VVWRARKGIAIAGLAALREKHENHHRMAPVLLGKRIGRAKPRETQLEPNFVTCVREDVIKERPRRGAVEMKKWGGETTGGQPGYFRAVTRTYKCL